MFGEVTYGELPYSDLITVRNYSKTLTSTITTTGSIIKETNKILIGSVTPFGIMNTVVMFILSISGSTTISSTLSKMTLKVLESSITSAGSIAKRIPKSLSSVITLTGSIVKNVNTFMFGSITPSSVLQKGLLLLQNTVGVITASGIGSGVKLAIPAIIRIVRHGLQLILGTQKR